MNEKLPLGIVVIGRNEGERLKKCFNSCLGQAETVIYVDSGSVDDSIDIANSLGVLVHVLDSAIPFTAARARNAGAEYLNSQFPQVKYIQFVDGDCELVDGWLSSAVAQLEACNETAIVCGHLIERYPDATCYNRLCQIEWNSPAGEINACGGIFMVRNSSFTAVSGFNSAVIAAEDDELCIRIRYEDHKIIKIDHNMAYHDADMTKFSQWWQRSKRAGHAYAQVNDMHGKGPYKYFRREVRSALLLGGFAPLIVICLAFFTNGWGLLLAGGYLLLIYRVKNSMKQQGWLSKDAWLYGASCILAKFPQFLGVSQYYSNRLWNKQSKIIEYKSASKSSSR